jgi:serine protease Do
MRWTAVIAVTAFLAWGIGLATPAILASRGTPPALAAMAAAGPENGFASLVERVSPAVVNIRVTKTDRMKLDLPEGEERFPFGPYFERFFGKRFPMQPPPEQGAGSGFIISQDGQVVTNNHVVEGAGEIVVKLADGEEYAATVLGRDPKTDLALLKIKPKKDLPTVMLGESQSLKVGEWVVAIGNPLGLSNTVTAGIVSAKGREIGAGPYDDFLQTDAPINPGNSGGPLVNLRGEVVGINTAIAAHGQGIGFAIPVDTAKLVVPQLASDGKVHRSWLGVNIQEVTPDLAKTFGMSEPRGALVSDVVADSPADKAGIKKGDVIVEFDGKTVKTSRELPRLVAGTPAGRDVTMKVMRDGKNLALHTTLAKADESKVAGEKERSAPGRGKVGLGLQEITPELARGMGLKEARGLVVTQVEPGSPAAKAGFQVGDVILEVNKEKVQTIRDAKQALEKAGSEGRNLFLVKRGDAQIYVATKLG